MALTDQLQPGSRLGNYELLAPIGRGGMATVWVARAVGQSGRRPAPAHLADGQAAGAGWP